MNNLSSLRNQLLLALGAIYIVFTVPTILHLQQLTGQGKNNQQIFHEQVYEFLISATEKMEGEAGFVLYDLVDQFMVESHLESQQKDALEQNLYQLMQAAINDHGAIDDPQVQKELFFDVANILLNSEDVTAERGEDFQSTYWWLPVLVQSMVLLAFMVIFFRYVYTAIAKAIRTIEQQLEQLKDGELPDAQNKIKFSEFSGQQENISALTREFELLHQLAANIGKGDFDQEISIFNNQGVVGASLFDMKTNLQQISKGEKVRRWTNEGVASFSEILRKHSDNLKTLSQEILSHLIRYIEANQGAVFLVNKEEDSGEVYLEMISCYAYNRKKFEYKKLLPGQSLVGQCYLEKQPIYLKKVPDNYINITSGMGGANPGNVFIVPLISNEETYGVVEIAGFKTITEHHQQFILKVSESIASAIASVKLNQNTKKLLEESQEATEQLRAQEEEMRQNVEELAATQEEMKRRQEELLSNEAKVKLIYQNSFDAIIITDQYANIDLFNPACCQIFQYTEQEVKNKNVKMLMPEHVASSHDEYVDKYRKTHHSSFVGATRIVTGKRKNGEHFPMRLKLEEAQVDGETIFIVFIEDLSEEQKMKQALETRNQELQAHQNDLLEYINSSGDTVFVIDKEYKILIVNNQLKQKYQSAGIELSEGKNILDVLSPEMLATWKERYDHGLAGKSSSFVEERDNERGEKMYFEVSVNPLRGEGDEIRAVSVISRNITSCLTSLEGQVNVTDERDPADVANLEQVIGKMKLNQHKLKNAIDNEQYIMKKE